MQNLAPINQDKDFVTKAYVDSLFAGSGGGGGTAEPSDLAAKVTALENDVDTLIGYFTGTKAKDADKLDGYDSSAFALAASLGALATKNSIAFSELTSKPTTLAGYGITDALGKNETAASATKLADSSDFNIWGQTFFTGGKPKSVTGLATFGDGIVIGEGQAITFLDDSGNSHTLSYDSENEAFKIDGDFYATGENSAGGMGEELEDGGGSGSAGTNIAIKVSQIITRSSMASSGMNTLGLTIPVAEKMTQGVYNKVIDSSSTYPVAWEYSAEKPGTNTVTVYLHKGADNYKVAYNGAGTWNISKI